MNPITKQTRRESYIKRPVTRAESILRILRKYKRGLTARQVAVKMGYSDLNYVKPRLTELAQDGAVEIVGKTLDLETNRSVAVWKAVDYEA